MLLLPWVTWETTVGYWTEKWHHRSTFIKISMAAAGKDFNGTKAEAGQQEGCSISHRDDGAWTTAVIWMLWDHFRFHKYFEVYGLDVGQKGEGSMMTDANSRSWFHQEPAWLSFPHWHLCFILSVSLCFLLQSNGSFASSEVLLSCYFKYHIAHSMS